MIKKNHLPIIKIDFSYKGTEFKGYQKQEDKRTVQGEIEKALQIIYRNPIETFAAGRTDTGVHALHQVISFKIPPLISVPVHKLPYILNSLLPPDIRVWDSSLQNASFHARFTAKQRTYQYIIHNTKNTSPFDFAYKWYYSFPLDIDKMKIALQYLIGEHNFASFTEKPSTNNLVRIIKSIDTQIKDDHIYITIVGNAFLRRMIRIIVGTATSIASYPDINPIEMKNILEEKCRNKNPFPTAPPQGLYFYRVEY